MDTDSIVYISTPGASGSYDIEVTSMDLLGHFTDELGGGKYIDNFVSTGPKSYAYRVADAEGVHSETVCKLKGFTLSHRNAKLIHFESMNDLVSGFQSKINTVTYNKICRNRYAPLLYSKDEETKSFRLTYTKRVIQPEVSRYGCTVVDTLPYGY